MAEGKVWVRRDREKPLRQKHPWLFSGAIAHAEAAQDGELVAVYDSRDRFLARGYWNSKSQIQTRILSWRDEAIDAAWWRRMLSQAIARRDLPAEDTACRLVNAENDYLPGLIVDRYGDWLVVQALTRAIDARKEKIADALLDLTGIPNIYERSDVEARQREGLSEAVGALRGAEPPATLAIKQDGIRYLVDMRRGHKTGFYLDQRDNRCLLRELAADCPKGARLLNLFSYTGGFAIAAGSGSHAVHVDSAYSALGLAEANTALNKIPAANAEFIQADAFDYLRHCVGAGERFDVVAVDPPKFAAHKRQIQRAARGYKDLNLHAFRLVKPGGWLMTFSCSGAISRELFQKIVFGALVDSRRRAQIVRQLGAASDHPVALTFPEGAYLKGLLLRVD
ncbi:MAG: class I SAM-dependent rRNA methyltransferase [Chloroflexi bacterium]|nr:class I SAM-dependent rRNA methyltransferase [Chloroflexota bacterium]MCY4247919.1 class I SAM-dependent rRNA methyltransferase [Chloroflexota bacterium]